MPRRSIESGMTEKDFPSEGVGEKIGKKEPEIVKKRKKKEVISPRASNGKQELTNNDREQEKSYRWEKFRDIHAQLIEQYGSYNSIPEEYRNALESKERELEGSEYPRLGEPSVVERIYASDKEGCRDIHAELIERYGSYNSIPEEYANALWGRQKQLDGEEHKGGAPSMLDRIYGI